MHRLLFTVFVLLIMCIINTAIAEKMNCGICGMEIKQKAKIHYIVNHENSKNKQLHLCSSICVKRLQEYDSKYNKIEVVNFNNSKIFLKAKEAFFPS